MRAISTCVYQIGYFIGKMCICLPIKIVKNVFGLLPKHKTVK